MRIDSHQHFWTVGRYPMVWMDDPLYAAIRNTYTPGDLQPYLEKHHIDGTVLVQAISSIDETRWFLEMAEHNTFIAGVVGWVDLTDPAVGDTLDGLLESPYLVGIRHQAHDEPDVNWLVRDDVQRGLGEIAKRNLPYDLLIRPPHLEASLQLAQNLPELLLDVNHIAKPVIKEQGWDDWAAGMKALGDCENVYCKVSGMITEADWANWKPEDLAPYIDHVIDVFGPDRLMFGTDWPVCTLAGTYTQVTEALEVNTTSLSDSEREALFGGTAERFYKLKNH